MALNAELSTELARLQAEAGESEVDLAAEPQGRQRALSHRHEWMFHATTARTPRSHVYGRVRLPEGAVVALPASHPQHAKGPVSQAGN